MTVHRANELPTINSSQFTNTETCVNRVLWPGQYLMNTTNVYITKTTALESVDNTSVLRLDGLQIHWL